MLFTEELELFCKVKWHQRPELLHLGSSFNFLNLWCYLHNFTLFMKGGDWQNFSIIFIILRFMTFLDCREYCWLSDSLVRLFGRWWVIVVEVLLVYNHGILVIMKYHFIFLEFLIIFCLFYCSWIGCNHIEALIFWNFFGHIYLFWKFYII